MATTQPQAQRPAIWTAVYLVQEDNVSNVEMLFTVASDEAGAEESFHGDLDVKYERTGDLAPEQIAQLPGVGERESTDDAINRLRTMGYRFVMPLRGQVPDEHVSKLVYALLSFGEIDRDE